MNEYIKVFKGFVIWDANGRRRSEVLRSTRCFLSVYVCEGDGHAPIFSSPDFSGLLFHFSPLFYYFLIHMNINNENEINHKS